MKFDDILYHLGEFGRYQKRLYILLCLPAISVGGFMMGLVLTMETPKHRYFLFSLSPSLSFELSFSCFSFSLLSFLLYDMTFSFFFLSFFTLISLLFTQQSANFFYDFFILISCMEAICFLNSNWSFPVFQSIAYLINDIYSAKTYCLISKVMIKYMYNLFNHFVN